VIPLGNLPVGSGRACTMRVEAGRSRSSPFEPPDHRSRSMQVAAGLGGVSKGRARSRPLITDQSQKVEDSLFVSDSLFVRDSYRQYGAFPRPLTHIYKRPMLILHIIIDLFHYLFLACHRSSLNPTIRREPNALRYSLCTSLYICSISRNHTYLRCPGGCRC
jgi:hypothetical protein